MDLPTPPGPWQRRTRPAFQTMDPSPTASEDADRTEEDELNTIIGKDILVTGNIEAEVDLHIDGRVQGDVRCATLILGERGSVVGNVFAGRIRVSGIIEGGIETTDLAIESTACVTGDVTYSRLRVASGGILAGNMTHKPLEERPPDAATLRLVQEGPAQDPKGRDVE